MTDHTRFHKMLGLRSELEEHEEEALRSHLADCAECRELETEYESQDMFLRAIRLPAAPTTFRAGVLGRVDRRQTRRGAWWWTRALSGMAAVAVLVLAVVMGHRSSGAPVDRAASDQSQPGTTVKGNPYFGPNQSNSASQSTGHAPTNGAAIAASPLVPPAIDRAAAGTKRSFGVPSAAAARAAVQDGTRLWLTLLPPKRTFHHGDTVAMQVRVVNRTGHAVQLENAQPGGCVAALPVLNVRDGRGRLLYPPANNSNPAIVDCAGEISGPGSVGYLDPGQARTFVPSARLLGRHIQAVARAFIFTGCDAHHVTKRCTGGWVLARSPVVTVKLTG